MDFFTTTSLLNLVTLTGLEIILGIDNVIFIALLVQPLKGAVRTRARIIGLSLALVFRIVMLMGASWIMKLTDPLFTFFFAFSGRSLLLIAGGLFLVIKSIMELIELLGEEEEVDTPKAKKVQYMKVIAEIIFIDIILSFDSIITAVGISNELPIMIIAVVIAIIVMLVASEPIGKFIYARPSIKVIALAFIAFLGLILVLGGFDIELDKGYLYFSMLFAGIIEFINIKLSNKQKTS